MIRAFQTLVIATTLVSLAGCTSLLTTSSELINADPDSLARLAGDAAGQMVEQLPPAQTIIAVQEPSPAGAFAIALTEQLRLAGFGVEQCGTPCVPTNGVLRLSYIASGVGDHGYRVSLFLPDFVLSRVYVRTEEGLQYAGLWTKGDWKQ